MSAKDFPFGPANTLHCWKMVAVYVLLILVSGVGLTTAYAGSVYVAQVAQAAASVSDAAELLAGKPMGYWLVALAIFVGTSFTIIVKWLLAQQESQRAANLALNATLIKYLSDDRAAALVELSKSNSLLDEAQRLLAEYKKDHPGIPK